MRSLWQQTGPSIQSDDFPTATKHEVVVVGAGLTGLTTAVLLARAGRRVTVLEGRTVGAVTTGNTTGKLSLLQGTTLSGIREHAGARIVDAYVQANREGQSWLLRELEHHEIEPDRRIAYTYAVTPEGVSALDAEYAACREAGFAVQKTDDAQLPFATSAALVLEDQAQLQPMEVLAMLATELRQHGGLLVEGCRVRDIDAGQDEVQIITSKGPLSAALCVLATGTPILDRGMFFARLEPSRSFAVAYDLPADRIPTGMYVSSDSPARSLRAAVGRDGEPVLVAGAGSHVTGRSPNTLAPLRELDAWVAENFGRAQRLTWWAAQDYRSHSRIPYAGKLPGGFDRIYTATGYNKWGMTNAVAAALTITADVLGGHLGWAEVLREHSLSFADVGATIKANAAVAGHLATGWAGAELSAPVDPEGLAEGEGVITHEGAAPVGVSRVRGEVCRVSGVCTHLGGVLNWNAAERSWDCPLHGSRFSATGEVLEGPALNDLRRDI